ncbi:MAG: PaaI family thioesterase [Pseudomonadota bacterium]|nr:PaaI family thioesterase [Pseudomonadota bacterium]
MKQIRPWGDSYQPFNYRHRMTDIRFHPPAGGLVPHMGITLVGEGDGWLEARMEIAQHHLRSGANALHAASMIALADSVCGFAAGNCLPEGAKGYTTIELKSNFVGTASEGVLIGRAEAEHLGRTTQVWNSTVRHEETGRTLALFRCTQMVLR